MPLNWLGCGFDDPGQQQHNLETMSTISRLTFLFGFIGLLMGAVFICHASGLAGRVSVIRVPVAGQAVKAMVGADGTIHLLLDSTQGPRYVKSQDSGRTFSEPMAIV